MIQASIAEFQKIILSHSRLSPGGGGSKTALAPVDPKDRLDLSRLEGFLEYQPSEYTFTARPGTRIAEVEQVLSEHGQFLPFDPPMKEQGATLGGTVASGLSGSGRYRFGGVRDFILAIQFLDGDGQLIRAGGKVVKNSAGFDLPKWMVGSLGAYGALVELTFKVFPKPKAFTSLRVRYPALDEAVKSLLQLSITPVDLFCLDLVPQPSGVDLLVRVGGMPESFPTRIERLESLIGDGETFEGNEEVELWREINEFLWLPQGSSLVKVPLTPHDVLPLDRFLSDHNVKRRYSVGANLAWVGWPGESDLLDKQLTQMELSGLVVLGQPGRPRIGLRKGGSFAKRVKQALDPAGRWMEV